jgi:hypothetical protein
LVLVPVLGVASPLALAVADPNGRHFPTIGTEIARFGEAPDWACFQHDRQAEDNTHSRHGEQRLVRWAQFDSPPQVIDSVFSDFSAQGQIFICGTQGGDMVCLELLDHAPR